MNHGTSIGGISSSGGSACITLEIDCITLLRSEFYDESSTQYPHSFIQETEGRDRHTGILPSPAYNSANAPICGARAFRFASHKLRIASAAWRHREGSVNAATTYPITVIRRFELELELEIGSRFGFELRCKFERDREDSGVWLANHVA
jgi:hypothetical protein